MDTLGLWLGPTLAVVLTAAVTWWLGWFQRSTSPIAPPRSPAPDCRAAKDSTGYDYKYERFLEHYLGGRDWHEEWEKADDQDRNGRFYDSRGPALRWWQRRSRESAMRPEQLGG
jgi:hypothetical protein